MKRFAIVDSISDETLSSIKTDILERYSIDLDKIIFDHSKENFTKVLVSLHDLLFKNSNIGKDPFIESLFRYDYYIYDEMLITSAEELLTSLGYSVIEK